MATLGYLTGYLVPYDYTVITELHFEGSEGSLGNGAYTDDAPSPLTWGAANSNGLIAAAAVYEGTRGLDLRSSRAIWQPSHYVGVGDSGFNFGSDDFTIELSTYFVTVPTTAGHYRLMIAKDDVASTRGWNFLSDGDNGGRVGFNIFSGGTPYSVRWSTVPSATTWYRFKAERLGNDLNLYVDTGSGYTLVDTADVTGVSVNSTSHPVGMGVLKNGGQIIPSSYHNGFMDYLLVRRKYP